MKNTYKYFLVFIFFPTVTNTLLKYKVISINVIKWTWLTMTICIFINIKYS